MITCATAAGTPSGWLAYAASNSLLACAVDGRPVSPGRQPGRTAGGGRPGRAARGTLPLERLQVIVPALAAADPLRLADTPAVIAAGRCHRLRRTACPPSRTAASPGAARSRSGWCRDCAPPAQDLGWSSAARGLGPRAGPRPRAALRPAQVLGGGAQSRHQPLRDRAAPGDAAVLDGGQAVRHAGDQAAPGRDHGGRVQMKPERIGGGERRDDHLQPLERQRPGGQRGLGGRAGRTAAPVACQGSRAVQRSSPQQPGDLLEAASRASRMASQPR